MTLGIKPKLVYASFSLTGLLWISSSLAASALDGVEKNDEPKWAAPIINKPVAIAPMPEAFLDINVSPVGARTADTKLALHEPVVKMPELTIGGKVKPPAKQTEMERYRLPQTTESITRERIDNTINMVNPEDAIKYIHRSKCATVTSAIPTHRSGCAPRAHPPVRAT